MQETFQTTYQQALNFVCKFYGISKLQAEEYYQDEIESTIKLIKKGIIK